MPVIANIAVSTISLAALPGYILSAYLSNNIHDANLILAGIINFFLYGSLTRGCSPGEVGGSWLLDLQLTDNQAVWPTERLQPFEGSV
jgi:hypothetical protein